MDLDQAVSAYWEARRKRAARWRSIQDRELPQMPDYDLYNPLTGENWDQISATAAWSESMDRVHREQRAPLRWQLHGGPGGWVWVFWNFGSWTGRVVIKHDGFHWTTRDYDTGHMIHTGKTTSLYEAFQSVEQNRRVSHGDR